MFNDSQGVNTITAAIEVRRRLKQAKRLAYALLIVAITGVVAWEIFAGPHPDNFGFRFSPEYCFTWRGVGFWFWVGSTGLSMLLLLYLYIGKNIAITCPECGTDAYSKDDWVCPGCNQTNRPIHGGATNAFYTVITKCRHCGESPAAYQCHECKSVFALDEGADLNKYAYKKTP